MPEQQTVSKLKEMSMAPMVDAAASVDGASGSLGKEEWLDILVDRLYEHRMATKTNNLIRAARLPCPEAHIEDLIADADRGLDIGLIDRLATCAFVDKGHNVIVLGASGAGKSRLVSALALSACRQLYRVECVPMPDMADEPGTLRHDPIAHAKRAKQLKTKQLLVIDDWLLEETKPEAVDGLFAVVDARTRSRKSTVACAQYRVEGWPSRMGDYPAAESIVDRLKNDAYAIELKGGVSMRGRRMDEELRACAKRQKRDWARAAQGVLAAPLDARATGPRGSGRGCRVVADRPGGHRLLSLRRSLRACRAHGARLRRLRDLRHRPRRRGDRPPGRPPGGV